MGELKVDFHGNQNAPHSPARSSGITKPRDHAHRQKFVNTPGKHSKRPYHIKYRKGNHSRPTPAHTGDSRNKFQDYSYKNTVPAQTGKQTPRQRFNLTPCNYVQEIVKIHGTPTSCVYGHQLGTSLVRSDLVNESDYTGDFIDLPDGSSVQNIRRYPLAKVHLRSVDFTGHIIAAVKDNIKSGVILAPQYSSQTVYRKGREHYLPDFLSRHCPDLETHEDTASPVQ